MLTINKSDRKTVGIVIELVSYSIDLKIVGFPCERDFYMQEIIRLVMFSSHSIPIKKLEFIRLRGGVQVIGHFSCERDFLFVL